MAGRQGVRRSSDDCRRLGRQGNRSGADPASRPSGIAIAAAVIGCTAIVGFVAWIAIPGLYREEIELSDIPTACGLMLTIVAIGGVALPAIYGMVAPSYGYANAWLVLGAASLVTTLCCLLIRRPGTLPA
jgi:hypothetical protein